MVPKKNRDTHHFTLDVWQHKILNVGAVIGLFCEKAYHCYILRKLGMLYSHLIKSKGNWLSRETNFSTPSSLSRTEKEVVFFSLADNL
jgi:hypothetical protein